MGMVPTMPEDLLISSRTNISSQAVAMRHRMRSHAHAVGVFSALAAHLHYKEAGRQVRFVPLTVFKEHTAEELDLQVRNKGTRRHQSINQLMQSINQPIS
jgi:hypothetical protein